MGTLETLVGAQLYYLAINLSILRKSVHAFPVYLVVFVDFCACVTFALDLVLTGT